MKAAILGDNGIEVRDIEKNLAPDRLLTVEEAATRLGCKKWWLYDNQDKLPFTLRLGRRGVRFSSNGIDKYIRQREGKQCECRTARRGRLG